MLDRLAGGEGAASLGQPTARASARLPARRALRTEFNRYCQTAYPRLVAEQHALLGDGARARAAVERAMTSAWRQWATVRELPDPMRWMRRTASQLATERRHRSSSAGELNRLASARDARPAVLNVLAELPSVQRRALVLHHMAGLSVAQVATEEGTDPATIGTRLAHGQFALARKLGAQDLIPWDAQRDPDTRWAAIQQWVGRELHALTVRLSPTADHTPDPATFERMARRQRATAGAAAAVALVGAVSATMATQLSSESLLSLLQAGDTGAVPDDGLLPGPASPELGAPDTPVIAPTDDPGPAVPDPTALLRPAPGPVIPLPANAGASGGDSRSSWGNDSDDGDHDHGDGDGDRGRSWHRADHHHDHGPRPPWAQWPPGGEFPWPGTFPPGPWQPPGQPRPPAQVAETLPAPQPEQVRMNMFAGPGNSAPAPEGRPGSAPGEPTAGPNNPGTGQPSAGQNQPAAAQNSPGQDQRGVGPSRPSPGPGNAGQDQPGARQPGSSGGQRGASEQQRARSNGDQHPSGGGRHRRADDDSDSDPSSGSRGSRGSDSDGGSRGSGRHRDSGESRGSHRDSGGDSDGGSGGSHGGGSHGGGSHSGGGSRGGGGGGSRGGGGGGGHH